MKTLHLTNFFLPEYSGATTRLYNIVQLLPHDVQILTSDKLTKGELVPAKQDTYGNINVQRLPIAFGTPGRPGLPWQVFSNIRQDTKTLAEGSAKFEFDIIHAHNSIVFGQAGVRVSEKTHKPLVLEYHGLAHDSVSGLFRAAKSYYIQRTDKDVMKKAAGIITLTNSLKKWIAANYRIPDDKITVVPNGADVERFAPKKEYRAKAEKLKQELKIGGKVAMYAGSMDRINGIEALARIIPESIQKKPDVCYIFLGGSGGNEILKALNSKYPANVKILSSVSYDDMPYYYSMCDIFVIPRPSTISSETIVPLKLLEVMAMGKPVVASDVGGLAEVIKHGENGYLFHKGDKESLKNTLLEALEADNTQISVNARQTILGNYTWEKSVATLSNLYQKLA